MESDCMDRKYKKHTYIGILKGIFHYFQISDYDILTQMGIEKYLGVS